MALVFCSVLFSFPSLAVRLPNVVSLPLPALGDRWQQDQLWTGAHMDGGEAARSSGRRKKTSDIPAFKIQNCSDFTLFTVLASNEWKIIISVFTNSELNCDKNTFHVGNCKWCRWLSIIQLYKYLFLFLFNSYHFYLNQATQISPMQD